MGLIHHCCILVLSIFVIRVASLGHVYMEVNVLQYDNPDGTSYHGQDFNGDRKCCDGNASSNCLQSRSDQCDTYFFFCIGGGVGSTVSRVSNGRCSGPHWSSANQVMENANSFSKSLMGHPLFIGRFDSWKSAGVEIVPTILDQDSVRGFDLIDNFTTTLTGITPDRDRLMAKPHIIQFQHLTSLSIELKIWCQDGYSGSQCDVQCNTDAFHTCDSHGRNGLPLPSCGDATVITLNLQNVADFPLSNLHDALFRFIMDNICPPDTTGIDITFLHIQNNGPVEFRASCSRSSTSVRYMIHDIEFQTYYFIHFYTQKTHLQSYFVSYGPVTSPPVVQKSSPSEDRLVLIRFVNFYNGDQSIECGNSIGCQTMIDVCYSSGCQGHVMYEARMSHNSTNMTSCNSDVVDPSTTQTPVSKSFYFVRLPSPSLSLTITVRVENKDVWTSNQIVNYTAGLNYKTAVPLEITFSSQTKILQLEAMIWCTTDTWGDHCDFSCQGSKVQNAECGANGRYECKTGYSGSHCDDINECTNNPCLHGGGCTNTVGSFSCRCDSGWTGANCRIDIDECSLGVCSNCTNTPGSFICHCQTGFSGKQCTDFDECTSNTRICSNHGTCLNTYGGYACLCQPGFTGTHCQNDINECTSNASICLNNGTCRNTNGSYACLCKSGFTGTHCQNDINECTSNASICLNNGTCRNTNGGYACLCKSGFTGTHCQNDINECTSNASICLNNGTCVDTYGGYKCSCKPGFTGPSCGIKQVCCIDMGDCQSNATTCMHGTCVNSTTGTECVCHEGFNGTFCSTDIDECFYSRPCVHGHCRNMAGNYTCGCLRGYTGRNCEADIDECLLDELRYHDRHICANNGTCINTPGDFHCKCTVGWISSSHCHRDIDECASENVCGHGTCHNTPGDYNCVCQRGWSGRHCDVCSLCTHGICNNTFTNSTCTCYSGWQGDTCSMDIDECSRNTTCIHGTCINSPGNYSCSCQNGWEGATCSTDIDECTRNSTCIHGTCINSPGNYSCSCQNGWQGDTCSTDIDECSRNSTCIHGTCINSPGNFSCSCQNGWQGDTCSQDINECSRIDTCKHGQCINFPGYYKCSCKNGWEDDSCSTDINECTRNGTCIHGICMNFPGYYNCSCHNGWAGDTCLTDIDECSRNNSCIHGTCMNYPGYYNCSCINGWTGPECATDIDECKLNQCLHGVCTNTRGSFQCQCEAGWQGVNCDQPVIVNETRLCQQHSPCLHGECNNTYGGYACTCFSGWSGGNCSLDIDECVGLNPCGNNRTCVNTPGSYNCTLSTVSKGFQLEDAISVGCDDLGWAITVDMIKLDLVSPGALASNIYLGDNTCTGTETGGQLVFREALDQCLTTEKTVNGNLVYSNELVYAERDPLLPFRIKHYNWTVSVECDVHKNQSTTVHVHHDSNGNGGHHVTGSSHYSVNMSFYSDPNFLSPVPGNPLHVQVGTKLYVKVFSTVPDWTVQMKVQTCYTKPGPDAPQKYFYYIIKDGCEVDTNTHILSQSTHETRFVFDDFEYTTNHEGIYVSCDAIFCEPNDVNPACRLICDPSDFVPIA